MNLPHTPLCLTLWLLSAFAIPSSGILHAAPPELILLQQTYDKAVAERVTAPFEAALTALNTKFVTLLENASAEAQKTGKLDDVLAIDEDKKSITSKLTLPDSDDEKIPELLKKLRAIYRGQFKNLDDQRTANHNTILPGYVAKLQALETTLTKVGRIDEAKELRTYREGLGTDSQPSGLVGSAPAGAKMESGMCVVWDFKGDPVDAKAPAVATMPGPKIRLRQIAGTHTANSQYVLAIKDNGKVIGWGGRGNYAGLQNREQL